MTTAGPNYAGTIASDSAVGSVAWTNIANLGAADTSYATVAPGSTGTYTSYYAKLTNLGFSIPAGATIDGITVEINRRCDQNGTRYTRDAHVRLIKADTIGATNNADTVNKWPTSFTVKSYGGSADLWSDTWTDSDINNSGFGVAFSCAVTRLAQAATAYVDYVRVTVTYTVGGTTYTQSVSGSLTGASTLSVEVRRGVTGSVTGAGALAKLTGRGVAGSVTSAGGLTRNVRKVFFGSVASAGALLAARTILVLLAGSVAAVGGLAKRVARAVGGSATGTGNVGRSVGKALAGGVPGVGGLAKRVGRGAAGSVTAQGGLTRRAAKGVGGSSTASGAVGVRVGKGASGTLAGAGAVARTIRKTLTGAIAATGLLNAIKGAALYLVNLAGSIATGGSLGRATRKGLSGQAQAQGSVMKTARKGLVGSLTPTGLLSRVRLLLLSIGGAVGLTGSLTRRTDKTQAGTVEANGSVAKRVDLSLTGLLAPIAALLARLFGPVKRGYALVGDRSVYGLALANGARWTVDLTDLARGGVLTATGPVYGVTVAGRSVYRVSVGDAA